MAEYKERVQLGSVISTHRRAQGLSQEALGKQLGVRQSAVSRWENGRRPEPEAFDKIAEFLGMHRDEVIRLAHTPEEDDGLEALIAARGPGWYEKPIEERRRIVDRMRELLEPE